MYIYIYIHIHIYIYIYVYAVRPLRQRWEPCYTVPQDTNQITYYTIPQYSILQYDMLYYTEVAPLRRPSTAAPAGLGEPPYNRLYYIIRSSLYNNMCNYNNIYIYIYIYIYDIIL